MDVSQWVLGLTENDLAYQNVLTQVTPGTTNPCKNACLWDVLSNMSVSGSTRLALNLGAFK